MLGQEKGTARQGKNRDHRKHRFRQVGNVMFERGEKEKDKRSEEILN